MSIICLRSSNLPHIHDHSLSTEAFWLLGSFTNLPKDSWTAEILPSTQTTAYTIAITCHNWQYMRNRAILYTSASTLQNFLDCTDFLVFNISSVREYTIIWRVTINSFFPKFPECQKDVNSHCLSSLCTTVELHLLFPQKKMNVTFFPIRRLSTFFSQDQFKI